MLGMAAPLRWPGEQQGGKGLTAHVRLERAWTGAEHAYVIRRPASLPSLRFFEEAVRQRSEEDIGVNPLPRGKGARAARASERAGVE